VHELVHTSWLWAAEQFELTLHGNGGKLIVAGLLAITVVAAVVLFHFVEEPARDCMRRMVDVSGRKADGRADQTARSTNGKLQSVDRALEARPKSISAR